MNGAGVARRAPAPAVTAATKLQVPPRRSGLVPREELVARLAQEGLKLVLVEAPAGFGKTTLLTEWHESEREPRRFAWVSLDRSDNDAVRFWDEVIAAVRAVVPGAGESAVPALRARGVTVSELALPLLINDLDEAGVGLVLVLDDYHVISNAAIHEAVAFLIDHAPRSLQVAIASRSEPPLPLARLRVESALVEVRPAALRFTSAEANALLNEVLALQLDPADVELLVSRTEGWIAGLQLAALSLRDEDDRHAFIEQFAGDDRQIVDYLVLEVLDRQPPDVREFLLRTAVLERLSGPLCDAVMEGSGSAAMLERIERSNLFLVPLDAKRQWYRYHHLFAQLLRHELGRASPELVPELHRRALAWHGEEGNVAEAIQHALLAGEVEQAADLIASNWFAFANLGRLGTVMGWLDSLPPEAVADDARLCIAHALVSYLLGRLDEVEPWLERAEESEFEGPLPDGTASSVASAVSTVRAAHSYFTGDVGRAIENARRVVEIETEGHAFLNNARGLLGASYFWSGERERAAQTLARVLEGARPGVDTIAMLHALGCLSAIALERGEVSEADRLSREGMRLAEEQGLAQHFAASLPNTCHGSVLLAQGDAAGAEQAVRHGIELAGRGAGRLFTAYGLLGLAGVLDAQVDAQGSRAALAEARETIAACPDPGRLAELLRQSERAASPAHRQTAEGDELSDRELAVLRLLTGPLSQREIASELYVSINTVKTHTRTIYRKLGAGGREEAVAIARARRLL